MTPNFEFNVADFDQAREHADDSKLFVVFYRGYERNEAKSLEAGRAVHDDVDMVKIMVPGQRDSVVSRATGEYRARFPRQWEQYKANAEQVGSGTRLAEVPWLTPAQVADLNAVNVRTVEQLSTLPDSNAHTFMGLQGLKQRAQAFLDAAAGAAPALKLQSELEKRDAEIAELRELVNNLVAEKKAAVAKKSHHKAADSLV